MPLIPLVMKILALILIGCWCLAANAAIPSIPQVPQLPVISANGGIYHVHNEQGKDTRYGGVESHPWKSLEYAVRNLRAGDTLIVHGTKSAYPMNWLSLAYSGNKQQWIVIKGKDGVGGEKAVLEERMTLGGENDAPVSFIKLENLVFKGGGASGLNVKINQGSHHLVFERIEIDCQKSGENERGVWVGNHAHDIWFKEISVHHCGYRRSSPTDCGGICVKGSNIDNVVFLGVKATDNVGDGLGGGSRTASGRSYFDGCTVARNTGDGIDIGGSIAVISGSISRNNGGHQGAGIKFWSRESWLIKSVIQNNDSVGVMVRPRHDGESNVYVLNSTFSLNSKNRFGGQVSTSPTDPKTGTLFFHVFNNIFHVANTSAIVLANSRKQVIKEEGNNYYFSSHDNRRNPHWAYIHAIHVRDGGRKVVQGYSFSDMAGKGRWERETGKGAGDIGEIDLDGKGNPGFVDVDAGDLHLIEGSSAIDAGVNIGLSTDLDGALIPAGLAPDMGAYEYRGQGGSQCSDMNCYVDP